MTGVRKQDTIHAQVWMRFGPTWLNTQTRADKFITLDMAPSDGAVRDKERSPGMANVAARCNKRCHVPMLVGYYAFHPKATGQGLVDYVRAGHPSDTNCSKFGVHFEQPRGDWSILAFAVRPGH